MLEESIERYGVDAYVGAVRYACDVSAEAMAEGLRSLPDGVYEGEDWLDGDGFPDSPEYRCGCGSPRSATAPRSTSEAARPPRDRRSTVPGPTSRPRSSYALKSVLDPTTPVTSGTLRNVDIVVPPDAMFNAMPPMPCQMYFLVVYTMVHAIYRALNPALGERAVATGFVTAAPSGHGKRPDGIEGHLVDSAGPSVIGAWGATPATATPTRRSRARSATSSTAASRSTSCAAQWCGWRATTCPTPAGAGTYRGGSAIMHDMMWRVPAAHTMQLLFHSRRPTAGGGCLRRQGRSHHRRRGSSTARSPTSGRRLPELPATTTR